MIPYYNVQDNIENLNNLVLNCNLSISNKLLKIDLLNQDFFRIECCRYFDSDDNVAIKFINIDDDSRFLFKLPLNSFDFHDLDTSITIIHNSSLCSVYIRIYFDN